jgi:lysophospholipid acyltransferase (LPLAT)-like uncharacterized protein
MRFAHHLLWKIGFHLRRRLSTELSWEWRAAVTFVAWLIRVYALTLRFRFHDEAGYRAQSRDAPLVLLLWHNRIIAMPAVYERFGAKDRKAAVLTSAGPEGSLLAALVGRFGLQAVRGSAARRGSVAVREMAARITAGADVMITPDGSRGPRYHLKPGALTLAQMTGCMLCPVHIEYSRYVRLRTWDGLAFPLPFARIDVRIAGPIHVAPDLRAEEFEAERRRVEELMCAALLMD